MFSKFTEIKQFRGIIQNVIRTASFKGYDENDEPILEEPKSGSLPKLTFEATIKLHGTNSGVTLDGDNVVALSRSRVITTASDNAGFAFFVDSHQDIFKEMLSKLQIQYKDKKVYLYGEWCGQGIQKNVAISKLPKRLVLFAVKIVDPKNTEEAFYVKLPKDISSPENDIYNSRAIWTKEITIDFNTPEVAQNEMIKLVDEIEAECPVGKYFGVEGVGEGIVVASYDNDVREHIFKVKGEKHAAKSGGKVKTLKPVDEAREQMKRDFVNNHACREWRLSQIYNEVFDVINDGQGDIKRTGEYIKAVIADVLKEEMDVLLDMKLEIKEVNGLISKVSREYMFSRMDAEVGL